jgi:aminoglycoside phosphotransferase (APT) family kinase protein
MTNPDVDLDASARGLSATFPDLGDVAPCRVIGWGFGSVVVETAGGIVFRLPRLPRVHEKFERLQALLTAIASHLPVAVPLPLWLSGSCEAFEHGAIGYVGLPGRVMTEESFYASDRAALARSIAAFIAALHAIPREDVPMLRVRTPVRRLEIETGVRDYVLPVLRERFSTDEYTLAEAWWARYLGDPEILIYDAKMTHGDIWWANMLVDETGSQVTGVLDWDEAVIGDPARDFGGLGYLGEDFMVAVLDAYADIVGREDAALRHRSALLFQVREFYGLRYAHAFPNMREMDDAVAKVRKVIGATPAS